MTRMTAAEFRALDKPKAKNKLNAEPVEIDGIRFASKREAERWIYLREREKAGEISHLERQPVFKLMAHGGRPVLSKSKRYPNGRQIKYIADFAYFDGEKRVVEDSKGFRTKEFILKKAFVEAQFPAVKIVEV